eukprot:COSAG04_NODE_10152_length_800_cov_1.696148_1_plen_123_part_10
MWQAQPTAVRLAAMLMLLRGGEVDAQDAFDQACSTLGHGWVLCSNDSGPDMCREIESYADESCYGIWEWGQRHGGPNARAADRMPCQPVPVSDPDDRGFQVLARRMACICDSCGPPPPPPPSP